MRNFKALLQYDGTGFHGWQIQTGLRTVQGELTRVLSLLDHRPVTVHGAGRTDAGVHAEGQVANFKLDRIFALRELRDAINGNLDFDVRVFDVEIAEDDFNARRWAKLKTYRYDIWTGDVVSPFVRDFVYHFRGELDLDQMRRAAAALVGRHDFRAFTVADSEARESVRTLRRLDIDIVKDRIRITAAADGFLKYMVRTMVGTLIAVGRNRIEAGSMTALLERGARSDAGPTAPASGLTLVSVDY
jgi:tRNA pseudouridine38-40 synthase